MSEALAFADRRRAVSLIESERLEEGFMDRAIVEDFCDGDIGCQSLTHDRLCRAAGDPLRISDSLRAVRRW